MRRRGLALLLAAVAVVGGVLAATGSGDDQRAEPAGRGGIDAPEVGRSESAIAIGRPVPLARGPDEARWAPVRRAVTARAQPRADAPAVTRVARQTPEGTENLVLALARTTDRAGKVWVRASVATLPNGRTGWIPREALGGYTTVTTRLRIDLRRLELTLRSAGRVVLRAPIGVGRPGAPTPRGRFYVRARLQGYEDPAYGPLAFGTSARSPTLTDWPAGGFVGIHGTDRPDLLPGRVSSGCVRLRNADILRLARLMPVGTPLDVV